MLDVSLYCNTITQQRLATVPLQFKIIYSLTLTICCGLSLLY